MIRENQETLNKLQIVLDLAMVVTALVLAYWLRFYNYEESHLGFESYVPALILLVPLHFLLYYFLGLYEPRRRQSITLEVGRIIRANLLSTMILLALLYFLKEIDYSRQVLIYFVVLTSVLTIGERVALRAILYNIRKNGYNKKHVLIIGTGRLAKRLIGALTENRYLGYEIIGIIDDNIEIGKKLAGIAVTGGVADLEDVIREGKIDEIFITISTKDYDKFRTIIKVCEKSGARTQIVPDYARFIPAKPQMDEIDGIPLINIRHVPLDNFLKAFSKRTFDIAFSFVGILICLPLLALIIIGIKIDSPGPVFFAQERVGLNKRHFKMYKFRTMKVQTSEDSDKEWTIKGDNRKTRLGNLLRKTSIDELPQLWNVLKGDMSLVGPRPERPFFVSQFKEKIPRYMVKHQVRPGITGWAQVNGWRGDTSIRKRIECDIYYIENWMFLFDVKILLMTLFKGFVNKNAY
ncbi:Undecaprenyl-phosphate glucose phosphotransferase [Desulfitobacterium dichloroeliminans LMG P-21439]|uniref:Undecaprenyl-phosphate glucose phosphotransferase n=1 Tax=Desulfitobacterium dichloroeliminans (strain LMG P-21439 / DCA1) TaxID=871963 RepID=L0FC81_DESDL|nr:undecaprenyl-phosphate glucose phosphotransferase [Desulfitobacterium dichloroeliminans]AGA70610.1 Undecaprenyl-phosphate glucose phosphotransferase [Desulfitobacterium dichloroeliminans LMG P-21439]